MTFRGTSGAGSSHCQYKYRQHLDPIILSSESVNQSRLEQLQNETRAAGAVQKTRDTMNFGNSQQFDFYEPDIEWRLLPHPYVGQAVIAP